MKIRYKNGFEGFASDKAAAALEKKGAAVIVKDEPTKKPEPPKAPEAKK